MADIDRLITSLSESAEAVRTEAPPFAIFLRWVAVSVLYIGGMLFFLGLREDLSARLASPLFITELALLAGIAVTAGISAATLSFPDMYQKRWLVWTPLLPLLCFIALMYIGWLDELPTEPRPVHGYQCLVCITLLSALPAVWMFYTLRTQASTHYYLTGGLSLLAAASLGCFALRFSEKTDSVSHLLLWHYCPMIGFGLLGLWLGRKILKW